VFFPAAIVPGDMVALARLRPEAIFVSHGIKRLASILLTANLERCAQGRFLGADGPASPMFCAMKGAQYLPRLNDAR